jgi:hypothetical protein
MGHDGIYLNLSSEEGPFQVQLENPIVYDIDTEIGMVSLILDKKFPQYLIIHIDNEPRKCVGLHEFNLEFKRDEDVNEFLVNVTTTEFFDELIADEISMNEGWSAL